MSYKLFPPIPNYIKPTFHTSLFPVYDYFKFSHALTISFQKYPYLIIITEKHISYLSLIILNINDGGVVIPKKYGRGSY